jgi:hypothetical protein
MSFLWFLAGFIWGGLVVITIAALVAEVYISFLWFLAGFILGGLAQIAIAALVVMVKSN